MTHLSFKAVLATAALAAAGCAFAQGTPPNPNVANPATAAGQQTQQGTSMGTTGVPTTGAGPAVQGNAMPSASMSNDTPNMPSNRRMRAARADRN